MARDPQILLRAVAVIALIAAALTAAAQLDGRTPSEHSEDASPTDDPLRAELERCRTITPEDLVTDTTCQAVWAENRRRFFGPADAAPDGNE
ncbi:putative entry exclusion protein TrbK-alt [Eilatimonas milleporae]|uniref:Conjugative transfer region protein TrbK n=1 Tax=Eilatimonas milleporae TaxID=911205 RepID=A0A3M0BWM3_9PROT|nr:putative entry exclusion protein TrbK-alt [Eilatimonas milleporae]RMB01991.1 conjugative transfer region protein TrbK [Eilatimonas milleporae]